METTDIREMTLPAILKRFDCGAWDHADYAWLSVKASQHAELLETLECAETLLILLGEEIASLGCNASKVLPRVQAAIREARGL